MKNIKILITMLSMFLCVGTVFSQNMSIGPIFSIQPELHFIQKGVQFEEVVDGQDETFKVKTNYLELPVLLKANYGGERFKGYAFVAPSLGYATNRFTKEIIGDEDDVKDDVDFIDEGDAQSQRWEFSTIGGIGGSMKAGLGSVVLDVRYSKMINQTIGKKRRTEDVPFQ